MSVLKRLLAALAIVVSASGPASAQWSYSLETDQTGLEYARLGVVAPQTGASIYAECTENRDLGLALILGASKAMIDQSAGAGAPILYMNEAGDTALATVSYTPGEGTLTLATPDRQAIEAALGVFANAREQVSVRFTFPPAPQVYEVVFSTEGLAGALDRLDAYCQ